MTITFEQYSDAFYDGYHVKCDELNGVRSSGRCKEMYAMKNNLPAQLAANKLRSILSKYTEFLQDKGYLDTDATLEEPNAIDEFIKHETSTNI